MKFEKALKKMKKGKRVYRTSLGGPDKWLSLPDASGFFVDEKGEEHDDIHCLAILDNSWKVVKEKSLGQIAYEAIYKHVGDWETSVDKRTYEEAAQAVIEAANKKS